MNGHSNHHDRFDSRNSSICSTGSNQMKYILITGGVISGIGKGILASSIGSVLKASGLKITSIKIDPYINIDAGTFSPYEHGEVFVLDDGGEVDLDLGECSERIAWFPVNFESPLVISSEFPIPSNDFESLRMVPIHSIHFK